MSHTDESESRVPDGRIRRSTIERFNDELSVLERPLESETEYYDDPPRRSPWRRVGMVAGAAALLGGIGVFALARVSSTTSDGGDLPKLAVALPPAATFAVAPAAPAPAVAAGEAAPATAPVVAAGEAAPASGRVVAAGDPSPAAAADRAAAGPEPEMGSSDGPEPSRLQPSRRAWANIRPAAQISKQETAHHKSRRHGRHR